MADDMPLLSTEAGPRPRRLGRSILALLAGFVAVVVLSIGADLTMHATRIFPALDQPMSDELLAIATAYRVLFGIVGGYITARLAPYGPMGHALVGGLVGLGLSITGAVATWNMAVTIGHHWYPLALVATAMPCAWVGGKLCVMQLSPHEVDWPANSK